MAPTPKPRIAGSKITWFLLTSTVGLLTGIGLADRTAIFGHLLGSPVQAAQVQQITQQLDDLTKSLTAHTIEPGHPVDHMLLKVVTDDIREIKQDVKELLRRVN